MEDELGLKPHEAPPVGRVRDDDLCHRPTPNAVAYLQVVAKLPKLTVALLT